MKICSQLAVTVWVRDGVELDDLAVFQRAESVFFDAAVVGEIPSNLKFCSKRKKESKMLLETQFSSNISCVLHHIQNFRQLLVVISDDESETLVSVEPLDGAGDFGEASHLHARGRAGDLLDSTSEHHCCVLVVMFLLFRF